MRIHPAWLLSLVLLFFCISSKAQFRIFAGPQMTSANYQIRNAKQEVDSKLGFMAGVGLTNQVEGQLYFAPSLYYSQKGYKVAFNRRVAPPDKEASNNNTTIHTINFALQLQWNFSSNKSHVSFRLGPSIDVAISGREIFDSTGGKQVDRSMRFGSLGYSPATAAANVQLGYEHESGLTVYAHYEHGLSSLNNADFGPIILQRIVGLSVGWKLGKK